MTVDALTGPDVKTLAHAVDHAVRELGVPAGVKSVRVSLVFDDESRSVFAFPVPRTQEVPCDRPTRPR